MGKPWLLIDVDGVLNPNPLMSGHLSERFAAQGFNVHKIRSKDFQWSFNVGLNPAHGEWLLAMTDVFRLGWATSWEHEANTKIGPKIGLPELPVAPVGNHGYKVAGILTLVGSDPFVWLDDCASPRETWELGNLHQGKHLVIDIDPYVGLTEDHLANAREWAQNGI